MHMLPSAALAGAFLKMCVKKAAGAARIGVRMGLADVKLAVSPCFDFVLETGKGRPLLFFYRTPTQEKEAFKAFGEKADLKPRSESLEGEILNALIMGGENSLAQQSNDAVGVRYGGLLAFRRGQI